MPQCSPPEQPWLPTAGAPRGTRAAWTDTSSLSHSTARSSPGAVSQTAASGAGDSGSGPCSQDFLSSISIATFVTIHTPWGWHIGKDGITLNHLTKQIIAAFTFPSSE